MEEFDVNELLLESYKKQVKTLNDLYYLINDELEILNTMIEITIPEEDYQKIRKQAMLVIKEREEQENERNK